MTEQLFPKLGRDEPKGLGTAMAGGKGRINLEKTDRRALDYYPTPAECTRALMFAEMGLLDATPGAALVWECCGRGGAIARVLAEFDLETVASDIVPDPENLVAQLDVLSARTALAPRVITNPPFAIAGGIIGHLWGQLKVDYLAMLLKQTFWQTDSEAGRGRIGLFRDHPPSRRWDLTWRPDFTGGGASTMPCSWFVWDRAAPVTHAPAWGLLSRDGPIGPRSDLFTKGE